MGERGGRERGKMKQAELKSTEPMQHREEVDGNAR